MSDEIVLGAPAVHFDEDNPPIPGSKVYNCQTCGLRLMLSPSSHRLADMGHVSCYPCLVRHTLASGTPVVFEVSEEALREMKDWKARN